MKRLLILLLSFLYLTSLCFAQSQNIYHNQKGNFSFIIPEDWVEIPKEVLEQQAANLKKKLKSFSKPIFSIAFQKESSSYFTYPYLLMRIDKNPISVFFLKRQLNSGGFKRLTKEDVEEATNGKIKLSSIGEVEYDETAKMFILVSENIVQGAGATKTMNVISFNSYGAVVLTFCALKDKYSDDVSDFNGIIASFQYDDQDR